MISTRQRFVPGVLSGHATVLRAIAKMMVQPDLSGEQYRRLAAGLRVISDQLMDVAALQIHQRLEGAFVVEPDSVEVKAADGE